MNPIQSQPTLLQRIDRGRYVEAIRSDGMTVFFDKATDPVSCWLNSVRATGNPQTVMLAVGLARGLQIALNYAQRYGKAEDEAAIEKQIEALTSNGLLAAP